MENKKRRSTGLLLSILGVVSLVLITAGVTYAFFSYAKQGITENTITTGTISFIYNETSDALRIQNALPKEDGDGITENASSAFTFTVTSTTPTSAYIDYIVTASEEEGSTLDSSQVKLFLTSTSTENETASGVQTGTTAGNIKTFYELDDASSFTNIKKTSQAGANEKVIYVGKIPASKTGGYTRTFRLNMWLKGATAVAAHCELNGQTVNVVQDECTGTGYEWVTASTSTEGVAEYSAFEFVKKTSATGNGPVSVASFTEGTDWLRSVPYYAGINASENPLTASEWTRIAYVNYTTKQIYTAEQAAVSGFTAPTGEGWQESEQYYPLSGGTFKIKVNVYAEGATTYTVNP